MRGVICILLAGLWLSSTSAAANEASGAAKASDASKEKSSQMICTREKVVGSNIKKRVCRTRAQEEEMRRVSQDTVSEFGRGATRSEGTQ